MNLECDDMLAVSVDRPDPATAVLGVSGEIDMMTAPQLNESIDEALRWRPEVLVIDLTGVRFFCSAGLSALLRAQAGAGEHTVVRIVAAGPATRRPLEMTGLTGTLTIYPDLVQALSCQPHPKPRTG